MKITQLHIDRFRHLRNLDIGIGPRLTAIAGQNGVGKSSILGLLGHVCREKTAFKTIDLSTFETEYSQIFKFSYPKFDKAKTHEYTVQFDTGSDVKVTSYSRTERGTKPSLRLRTNKTENGVKDESKIDFPVLYLGLKRLFPLAQEIVVDQQVGDLTDQEKDFFHKAHASILLMSDVVVPEQVQSTNKSFYAASTAAYDSFGNSAGQDNTGQILTAILSFQRLKAALGNEYRGGLLLIDELDATLFSAAQEKLIEFLFKQSSDLDLQIVFTTHSIEILVLLLTSKYRHESRVCFLDRSGGSVQITPGNDIDQIVSNLQAKVLKKINSISKIDSYVEDSEAKIFLENIVDAENKKKIKIIVASLGASTLLELANRNIPAFKNHTIILDGDQKESVKKPHPKNVITLPGAVRPEDIVFTFLKSLDESHSFWGTFGSNTAYTKQICFRDRQQIGNREQMKTWFNQELPYWGIKGNRLFKYWKPENEQSVIDFNKKLAKVIQRLCHD